MNKAFLLFLLLLSCTSYGQEGPTYIEPAGGGKFRFHFNEQYFLVDKTCEFLSRVRIASLNAEKQYLGDFTDYDPEGRILLTGTYTNGKRNGTFKSFYTNGFLRWQGNFKDNEPHGVWNYYYPDGKPKTILDFRATNTHVMESWNEKGKQVVKNGEGNFSLIDFQFGYNNTGHESLLYTGRIRDGLPHGPWAVKYVFPDRSTEHHTSVTFNQGVPSTPVKIMLAETEAFGNAENFIAKNCSIDDQTNFTEHLRNKLNLSFDFSTLPQDSYPEFVEASLKVTKNGPPEEITVETALGKAGIASLTEVLGSISYWIPSQKDGKVIEDTLKIRIEVMKGDYDSLAFGYPVISRSLGK